MRSVAPMHAAKIGYIVISLVLCLMGMLLIAMPNFSASLFDTICGIVLVTFGAIKIVGYFSKDPYLRLWAGGILWLQFSAELALWSQGLCAQL